MERCPNGFRRVGNECVPIAKTKTKTKKKRQNKPLDFVKADSLDSDPYAKLNKFGSKVYQFWNRRPKIPAFISANPQLGWSAEVAEGIVDLQFDILKDISDGEYKDVDLYDTSSTIQRDNVENLGMHLFYGPGGTRI